MKKLRRNVLLGMALTAAASLSASAASVDAAGQPGVGGADAATEPGISIVSSSVNAALNPAVYGPPEWFRTDPEEEENFEANEDVYGPPEWFDSNDPVNPEDDTTVPDHQGTPSAGIGNPFRVLARMIAFLGSFLRFLYHGR